MSCPNPGATLAIGGVEDGAPRLVANGATEGSGVVAVQCMVRDNIRYLVAADISLTGNGDGAVSMYFSTDDYGMSQHAMIAVTMHGATWSSPTCQTTPRTIRPSRPGRGADARDYFAGFKCTAAEGATPGTACDIEGEIRLTTCAPNEKVYGMLDGGP